MQCSCNDEYDPKYHKWGYDASNDFEELLANRGWRCVSCKSIIKPGDECLKFRRYRHPNCDYEENRFGDCAEIPLAAWYMCFECGGLYLSLSQLVCVNIAANIRDELAAYHEMIAEMKGEK